MIDPKRLPKGRDKMDKMLRKIFIEKYGLPKTERKTSAHPDAAALSDYINKALDASEMENIKTHLESCRICQREVKSALDAVRRFKSGDLEKVPDNVSFDVSAYLNKLRSKDSGKHPKK